MNNNETNNQQVDMVNHPPHYTAHPSGVECIQITRHMNFNAGNALKYLWRSDLKNGEQDIKKAIWYLNDWLTNTPRVLAFYDNIHQIVCYEDLAYHPNVNLRVSVKREEITRHYPKHIGYAISAILDSAPKLALKWLTENEQSKN